ncbi:MAG: 50S ribosomal protein L1 [Candidatus Aenigmarchaeota archaeon]|nr:50S ribosomal protein L1 [Candidatus Aenigmarchaeota archaeon]
MLKKEKILEALKRLRESSKKRNFVQSVDLVINLKGLDLRKPENRLEKDVILPYGRGEDAKIVVFADTIRNLEVPILTSKDIENLSKNKREVKKLARRTDFFLAEPSLMPVVGKFLGRFLGPRGKMPRILRGDSGKMIEEYKKAITIRVKNNPVVQCLVGKENMKDEEIAENVMEVYKTLISLLPKGEVNVKNIYLKFTMSKPVKVEVK